MTASFANERILGLRTRIARWTRTMAHEFPLFLPSYGKRARQGPGHQYTTFYDFHTKPFRSEQGNRI